MTNNQRICYVVGAMSLSPSLRPYPAPGDYVIAADRGYDSLMAYGVTPDLVVGDFDSLGRTPSHPNVIQLPAEKDDTDMVYALRKGLELGYRRFVLLGGVGGRLEHTLGNLQLLDWLTSPGAHGFLAGRKTAGHRPPEQFPHLPRFHVWLSICVLQQRHSGGGHPHWAQISAGPVSNGGQFPHWGQQ